jgi:hypothetical protein
MKGQIFGFVCFVVTMFERPMGVGQDWKELILGVRKVKGMDDFQEGGLQVLLTRSNCRVQDKHRLPVAYDDRVDRFEEVIGGDGENRK